jgi:hypothetical protein
LVDGGVAVKEGWVKPLGDLTHLDRCGDVTDGDGYRLQRERFWGKWSESWTRRQKFWRVKGVGPLRRRSVTAAKL